MILIELTAVPNQSFSITIDNNVWSIIIQQIAGDITIQNEVVTQINNVMMSSTISLNNELIQEGARIVSGALLLPFRYQEQGNFVLTSTNDDYPDYQQFGISQFLYYISPSELAGLREANNGT